MIISIISDLKLRDPYLSIIKAGILSLNHSVQMIDIAHAIPIGNVSQTAYLMSGSYAAFPIDTLHLIYTDCLCMPEALPVWVACNQHYFLGADTGVFSLFLDMEKCKAAIFNEESEQNGGFIEKMQQMLDWHIRGTITEHTKLYSLTQKFKSEAFFNTPVNTIEGEISYIDSACNALTNIPVSLFLDKWKGTRFKVFIGQSDITASHYCEKELTNNIETYLAPNLMGYLEIKMKGGNYAPLTGVSLEDKVKIIFE